MGGESSDATTELVGLDEFVVTSRWLMGGQWTFWIERCPLGPVGCPGLSLIHI